MFGKSKGNAADTKRDLSSNPEVKHSPIEQPAAPEATSSISPGLSIIGKIVGQGRVAIFGHVEGEVHASTVQIGDGAQVEGNIVAEELTIGGRVKGTIHANRVKLNSTAVVEGDIHHRSLAIEENAQFEGMSRRQENAIDTQSRAPAKRPQAQGINVNGHGDGALEGVTPSQGQTTPTDRKGRGNNPSNIPNS